MPDENEGVAFPEVGHLKVRGDELEIVAESASQVPNGDVETQNPGWLTGTGPHEVHASCLPIWWQELLDERTACWDQRGHRRPGIFVDGGEVQYIVTATLADNVTRFQLHDQVERCRPGRALGLLSSARPLVCDV